MSQSITLYPDRYKIQTPLLNSLLTGSNSLCTYHRNLLIIKDIVFTACDWCRFSHKPIYKCLL